MMRTSVAHSSAFSGEKPAAIRRTTGSGKQHRGQRQHAQIERQRRQHAVGQRVSRPRATRCATSRRRWGRTPSTSAPSANRSRSRFGMRNAAKNASLVAPAPSVSAKICSRARPSRRDNMVSALSRRELLAISVGAVAAARFRSPRPSRRFPAAPPARRPDREAATADGGQLLEQRPIGRRLAARGQTIEHLDGVVGRRRRRPHHAAARRRRRRSRAVRSCRCGPSAPPRGRRSPAAAALTDASVSAIASRSSGFASLADRGDQRRRAPDGGRGSRAKIARSTPRPQLGAAAATASMAASRGGGASVFIARPRSRYRPARPRRAGTSHSSSCAGTAPSSNAPSAAAAAASVQSASPSWSAPRPSNNTPPRASGTAASAASRTPGSPLAIACPSCAGPRRSATRPAPRDHRACAP